MAATAVDRPPPAAGEPEDEFVNFVQGQEEKRFQSYLQTHAERVGRNRLEEGENFSVRRRERRQREDDDLTGINFEEIVEPTPWMENLRDRLVKNQRRLLAGWRMIASLEVLDERAIRSLKRLQDLHRLISGLKAEYEDARAEAREERKERLARELITNSRPRRVELGSHAKATLRQITEAAHPPQVERRDTKQERRQSLLLRKSAIELAQKRVELSKQFAGSPDPVDDAACGFVEGWLTIEEVRIVKDIFSKPAKKYAERAFRQRNQPVQQKKDKKGVKKKKRR